MITEEDEDEKGLSELMYQIQYLQLFGLTEFDEAIIGEKIEAVYKQLEKEPFLDELFEYHTYNGYMSKEFMFRTLFSYEYKFRRENERISKIIYRFIRSKHLCINKYIKLYNIILIVY
jgi:hypothetical protein